MVTFLIIFTRTGGTLKSQPSKGLQKFGMWNIILAILAEYFFLCVNIFHIIKTLIQDRKKAKLDKATGKKKMEKQDDILVYRYESMETSASLAANSSLKKRKRKKRKKKHMLSKMEKNSTLESDASSQAGSRNSKKTKSKSKNKLNTIRLRPSAN
jgi:hypothetical protein